MLNSANNLLDVYSPNPTMRRSGWPASSTKTGRSRSAKGISHAAVLARLLEVAEAHASRLEAHQTNLLAFASKRRLPRM